MGSEMCIRDSTEPSELFGPFDLRKLREGDLVTNTQGMLPEADFVFLDELLNANSAVLNSLLLALNERIFRRGRERVPVPMLMAIGASNNLPEDEALAALFDRFLLRVHCDNVDTKRLGEVLDAGWRRERSEPATATMTVDDIRKLQQAVVLVDLGPARKAYLNLIERLRDAGMPISDRRAVRLQRVIAASAIICGRSAAQVSDIWVLRYIWDSPAQMEMLAAHVQSVIEQFSEAKSNDTGHGDTGHDGAKHPLANPVTGPDPERIASSLDEIADQLEQPGVTDSLSLISSRIEWIGNCLLYTSPSPRDLSTSRMPSSA